MGIKSVFATAAVAVVTLAYGLSALQAAEVEGPELTWNLSLWGKKRAFTAGAEKLSELLSAKTGGNWTLELHYGEALSKLTGKDFGTDRKAWLKWYRNEQLEKRRRARKDDADEPI